MEGFFKFILCMMLAVLLCSFTTGLLGLWAGVVVALVVIPASIHYGLN